MSCMIKAIKNLFKTITGAIQALGHKLLKKFISDKNSLYFIIDRGNGNYMSLFKRVHAHYNWGPYNKSRSEIFSADELHSGNGCEADFSVDRNPECSNDKLLEKAFHYITSYFGVEWEGHFTWECVAECNNRLVVCLTNL